MIDSSSPRAASVHSKVADGEGRARDDERPLDAARVHLRRAPGLTLGMMFAAIAGVVATAAVIALASFFDVYSTGWVISAAGIGVLVSVVSMLLATRRLRQSLSALVDGIRNFRTGDFSVRLATGANDEIGDLLALYNELADALRRERGELYQRELLLDTLLQTAPVATVLVSESDRVVFSNRAARHLLGDGRRLEGRRFSEVLDECSPAMKDALAAGTRCLFTVSDGTADEMFRATRTTFNLNLRKHTLYTVERLTPELRRHEVQTWKNAIRMINHELTNSLAPVRSLAHSGRRVLENPEHRHRLEEVFAAIEERVTHLSAFLDGYGQLAKVPPPRQELVSWDGFLARLGEMTSFRLESDVPSSPGYFDPGLLEQALINLFKNAHESGSPPEDVRLRLEALADGGVVIRVLDRGPGMDDDRLPQALMPFYTSKSTGTGLGLSLSREILEVHGGSISLENRPDGGLMVTCRLPGPSPT